MFVVSNWSTFAYTIEILLGNHTLKIIISSSGRTPTNKSRKINKSTQKI